jgi:hypothetical protein
VAKFSGIMIPSTPNPPTQSDRLLSTQGLLVNQKIASVDGRFNMTLQSDGNLVLYGPQHQPLWTFQTSGNSDVYNVVMQEDGNLVAYDQFNNSLWASNTPGHPGAILILHDDGNAVIYAANSATIWATHTVVPVTPNEPAQPRDRLLSGQGLLSGESLDSPNGDYRLVLLANGNLEEYGSNNEKVWASNTSGNTNIWDAIMQPDGNFVVHNTFGVALWASDTSGNDGATFVIGDGGGLVIYNAKNQSIWSVGKVPASELNTEGSTVSATSANTTNTTSSNATTSPTTGLGGSSSHEVEIVGGVLGGVILILLVGFWLAMRKCGRVTGMSKRNERSSANL